MLGMTGTAAWKGGRCQFVNSQASGTLASGRGLQQGWEGFWLSLAAESGLDAAALSASRSWTNRLARVTTVV